MSEIELQQQRDRRRKTNNFTTKKYEKLSN